jgi:hypothetical protein
VQALQKVPLNKICSARSHPGPGRANIIGVDLTKRVFRVYEVLSDGAVAFRNQISRAKLLSFLSFQMEEAAGAVRQCGGVNRGLRANGHRRRGLQANGHRRRGRDGQLTDAFSSARASVMDPIRRLP